MILKQVQNYNRHSTPGISACLESGWNRQNVLKWVKVRAFRYKFSIFLQTLFEFLWNFDQFQCWCRYRNLTYFNSKIYDVWTPKWFIKMAVALSNVENRWKARKMWHLHLENKARQYWYKKRKKCTFEQMFPLCLWIRNKSNKLLVVE